MGTQGHKLGNYGTVQRDTVAVGTVGEVMGTLDIRLVFSLLYRLYSGLGGGQSGVGLI